MSPPRLRETLRAIARRPATAPALPREPAVAKARARIPADLLGLAAPMPGRVDQARSRHIAAWIRRGQPLDDWTLRDAAWCLWATRPALTADPPVFRAVLAAMAASPRRQVFRALASAWMTSFDPAVPGMAEAGRLLRAQAPHMGEPWSELAAAWEIFDPERGPRRVAEAALAAGSSPAAMLRRGGLGRLGTGYVRAALERLLERVSQGGVVDPLERLACVQAAALRADGALTFPTLAPQVCAALLRPFGAATPDHPVRDAFLAVLLKAFGDPRLRPSNWAAMPEARDTVHRWLTRQAVRLFLEAGDRASREPSAPAHLWPARRRFWASADASGLVAEAWLLLDTADIDPTRRAHGEQVSFGRLQREEPGTTRRGAALLARLATPAGSPQPAAPSADGLLASDWSEGGPTTLWREGTGSAPRLFKGLYRRAEITPEGASDPAAERVPHEGDWQARMTEALRKAGLSPPRMEED